MLIFAIRLFAQYPDTWNSADYAASVAAKELQAKRIIPPAPEAAELGKYGNIPIGLFTGTPNISIPIFDVSGTRLKLPISMTYNSSGFKPQEMAGWVGLAWSLNAGGVITRSIAGNPDVQGNYFTTPNYISALPTDQSNIYSLYEYMKLLENGTYESSPDTYFYNFAGHTGKFFISPDQTILKKEKNDLKITPPCFTCQPTSGNFSIVDDQGTVYQFSDVEQGTTALDDGSGTYLITHNYSYISSWYLTSMTSADGQESVTFDYTSPGSNHTLFRNFLNSQSVTYSTRSDNGNSTQQNTATSTPPIITTNRKYLSAITFKKANATTCRVVFETSLNQRLDLDHNDFQDEQLLNDIKVYNYIATGNGRSLTLVKQFNLSYSYFGDPSSINYYNKRLRLDNIQEVSITGGSAKPPYTFTYNNAPVPSYGGASIDHWGYANGGEASTLVPSVPSPGGGSMSYGLGANRDPNLAYTANTVMTRITYPTGGYTQFVYELNDALDNTGALKPVGGLRLNQTSDYSFASQKAVTKTYQYKMNDGTSSGHANFPQYVSLSTYNYYSAQTFGQAYQPNYSIGYVTVSASTLAGLGAFHGSHIGYAQVISASADIITGQPLGKTVSKFSIGNLGGNDDDVGSGDLVDQQQFDKDNNILEEQLNTYNNQSLAGIVGYTIHPAAVQDNLLALCKYLLNGGTSYIWEHGNESSPACQELRNYVSKTNYIPFSYSSQSHYLVDQIDKKFDPATGTSVTEEKKITYGNPAYTYPTHIEEKTGDAEWLITDTKYAGDYTVVNPQDAQSASIALLKSKNMVSTNIESSQYLTTGDGTPRYTAGVLNFYSSTQPYLQQISRLEMVQPLSSLALSDASTGTFNFDTHYKPWGSFKYDAYGNIIEQGRTGAIPTCYVWDYNATLPIAEVKGVTSTDIAYTSFETGNAGTWSLPATGSVSGGVTGSLSYNLASGQSISRTGLTAGNQYVVSYWSKNGVLTVSTNTGNVIGTGGVAHNGWVFYQHNLPGGSTSVTLSSSSGANIDELRLFPRGAQMTTTAYNPYVGEASRSNVNNTVLNYQYDGLNRLTTITDFDGSIVKAFLYNYGTAITAPSVAPQTLFFNAEQHSTYTKNNGCPSGASPGTAVYSVPYARYVSSLSQADADSKATADVNNNGQNYANATAQCFYYNAVINHQRIFQTNCTAAQGGANGPYFYTLASGVFSSTLSQADADAQAQAQGQAEANARPCACGGEGQKVVNGNCETGTRHNSSSVLQSNGTYLCTYYYQFSDSSVSPNYTSTSSSPCPIQ